MATESIDMTPTWQEIVGTLLAIYENGDAKGRKFAGAELQKMARLADIASIVLGAHRRPDAPSIPEADAIMARLAELHAIATDETRDSNVRTHANNELSTLLGADADADAPAPEVQPAAGPTYCCEDCGELFDDSDMDSDDGANETGFRSYIHHISERVGPGEPMPAGQCNLCGALVHMTADETK